MIELCGKTVWGLRSGVECRKLHIKLRLRDVHSKLFDMLDPSRLQSGKYLFKLSWVGKEIYLSCVSRFCQPIKYNSMAMKWGSGKERHRQRLGASEGVSMRERGLGGGRCKGEGRVRAMFFSREYQKYIFFILFSRMLCSLA